ncbi:hypothetical protein [Mycobacterium sp.]|nr:hypothetical protein [Mycobacterium sp.]
MTPHVRLLSQSAKPEHRAVVGFPQYLSDQVIAYVCAIGSRPSTAAAGG